MITMEEIEAYAEQIAAHGNNNAKTDALLGHLTPSDIIAIGVLAVAIKFGQRMPDIQEKPNPCPH